MMPTHGDPLRHDPLDFMDSDPERWLPDPSWPVPPRGWQLWAAAGPAARSGVARGVASTRTAESDASFTAAGTVVGHTDGVTSDQSRCAVLEDTSFTLPTRPALDRCETVDLLAEVPRRRLPEGTIPGFAILGGLVVFSSLVGGLTGGLVVTGVSTLLAASAALVRGRVTLAQVGGPRGAGLLLGVAVTALIVGTVATHERSSRLPSVPAAPMPAGSPRVSQAQTSYAAVPPSGVDASVPSPTATATTARAATATAPETASSTASARPSAAVSAAAGSPDAAAGSPGAGGGLTLSPDVLSPKPTGVAAVPGPEKPITANDPKDDKGAKDPKAAKDDKAAKAAKAAKDKSGADPKGPAGLIELATGKAGKTGKANPGNGHGTSTPRTPGTAAGAARSVVAR
jgi:hypothetical protein